MTDQQQKNFQNIASEFIKHSLQGRCDGRTVQAEQIANVALYMAAKTFHLTRNVSGISNRKICQNGKRP